MPTLTDPEDAPQDPTISSEALETIATHCALAAMCPLVPLPFVDELLVARIQRRMNGQLCARHDIELTTRTAKLLTHRDPEFIKGALTGLLIWPIKKLVRTALVVLLVKKCADVATLLFLDGWMLARALEQGYVPLEQLRHEQEPAARQINLAIRHAHEDIDSGATRRAMRAAFDVSGELFEAVIGAVRGALGGGSSREARLEAATREIAPISERIQRAIGQGWSQGPELDAALRAGLREARRQAEREQGEA